MKAILMLIALALLVMAAVVGVQRASFVSAAVPTSGTVVDVQARDSRCGRKPRRACTKFTATVEYSVGSDTRRISTGAGQSRGRGEPITRARYRIGDAFALRVHPKTREALPDSFSGLWGLPLVLGLVGGLLAFFGVAGTRRR
jgi:hypothetical protein